MGLFSKLFSNNNNVTLVDSQQPEVYNVQKIHEQIKVDPNYRAATTQPSIFLNGNYSGNVTVFSFLGTNWTVTTQDGIVSIQTTGGGGGGSFVVKKDGNVIVASTTNLNFTGTNITVAQDSVNLNQANISVTGGGGLGAFLSTFFTYTYTYIENPGQFPLLFNLLDATSIIPSPPTGWAWSVVGGIEGTDYIFTTGKGKTTQNPQVTFNVPSNLQAGYTLTLLPSSTAIPPINYLPYSIQIPPQPLPFTTGNYAFSIAFNNPPNTLSKPYWLTTPTDAFVFQGFLTSYLKCVSASAIFSSSTPAPTINITADDINSRNIVTSSIITGQIFPTTYTLDIQAYMYNADGITSTLVEKFQDLSYYTPAFWIQNSNLTAPTFDITSSQVRQKTYQAGQSILFTGGTDIQVIWVAFPAPYPLPPTPPTSPPSAFVVYQGEYVGTADIISNTPNQQNLGLGNVGFNYYIYGYQIGYTGFTTYPATLFLEAILTDTVKSDTNSIVEAQANETQATETPKLGFFKRLFGAKS